jgi:hypothetical protein
VKNKKGINGFPFIPVILSYPASALTVLQKIKQDGDQ